MNLRAPLDEGAVRKLRLGDEVSLSGPIVIARDEAHMRALELLEKGGPLPDVLDSPVIFHCGPIAVTDGDGTRLLAAGPTTSARMNSLEPRFIRGFNVRAIIGKGGMDRAVSDAMREVGCVYLAMTGGAAALAAKRLRDPVMHWPDLGMAEAMWSVEADGLGPMIVAMDSDGGSLYDEVNRRAEGNLKDAKAWLRSR